MGKVVAGLQVAMALCGIFAMLYLFITHRRDRRRWKERDAALDKDLRELRERRDRLIEEVNAAAGGLGHEEEGKETLH